MSLWELLFYNLGPRTNSSLGENRNRRQIKFPGAPAPLALFLSFVGTMNEGQKLQNLLMFPFLLNHPLSCQCEVFTCLPSSPSHGQCSAQTLVPHRTPAKAFSASFPASTCFADISILFPSGNCIKRPLALLYSGWPPLRWAPRVLRGHSAMATLA